MLNSHDLGIIADDLTGACDVAACFAPQLGSIRVAVSLDLATAAGEELQVANTQSRLADQVSARELLRQVGSTLAAKKVIFKKIDAGLRGPVGAELAGLLSGLNTSGDRWKSVVAPAIPSIGRITQRGIQYDHGVPIHQSALGQDPHSPPSSADIRQVIMQTGGEDYEIADAESSEDLDRIVDGNLRQERVVFAGSLGLARALANRICANPWSVENGPRAQRPLLVCGSRHPQSAKQLEQVKRAKVHTFEFDPAARSFSSAIDVDAKPPFLVSVKSGNGTVADESAERLLAALVQAVATIIERLKPDGLAVIGGETAFQLLGRLGARRLEVFGSDAEVIARSRISGGVMDGCRFISKGGSVGTDDAASRMLALLTS